MKERLKDALALVLLRKGFLVKNVSGACDLLARKESQILMLKVIEDANSATQQSILELKKTATMLKASPVLISEKATKKLKDNVVYSRHDLDTVNVETFKNLLNEKPVFIRSKKAGLSAQIRGNKVRELREKNDLSLHACAKLLGVSPSMVRRYEQENAEVSIQRAIKMYDRLGADIFENITLGRYGTEDWIHSQTPIGRKYEVLGFNSAETKRQPFDIIARKEHELILTRVGEKINKNLDSISSLLGSRNLVIFERKKPRDFPALKKEEFLELGNASELLDFLRDF